ncbi:MAG TPA: phosphate ABC transporter substrate-binding protein PstS [Gaiellaceae bacterium]|nr:phosphate ABC transporter substrate-binding protein PstS [Gaiellaceae bacterium]
MTINGAGSSLIAPAIQGTYWAKHFHGATGNTVNYSSVGSGTGEKAIDTRQVSFGASDAPLSVYKNTPNPCAGCVQIPWALTGTVPVANIGLANGKLHLTGTVLANIYLGKITTWNNSAIKKINPGVKLPSKPISVVYRSDGSGDTYVWTHYLSAVSKAWKSRVGFSTTITNWPTGTGFKGNSGVAAAVKSTPGAIGYVSAAYVGSSHLDSAALQNRSSHYVTVSINAIAQAAKIVTKVPSNNEISLVNPPASSKYAGAWPISTFTYVFLHKNGDLNAAATNTTKAFIKWALQHGQYMIRPLTFAPLSSIVINASLKTLGQVSFK